MVLRLKVLRQQEQRINKIKDMMDMYSVKLPGVSYPTYEYQPVGGSSLLSNSTVESKIRDLFQMFHVAR